MNLHRWSLKAYSGSFRRAFSALINTRVLTPVIVCLISILAIIGAVNSPVANAAPGINRTINFQGRLFDSTGAVVPDGWYNIEFKIYQDGDGQSVGTTGNPSGTPEWTETHVNNNASQGIRVKNGFLSVELGAKTPFSNSVDWNQDTLWLSMNIAGSANDCTTFDAGTCVADGEMTPMKRMTATPYSLNSGALNGLTSSNFVQLAQGVQTDASSNTSSVFINKTGTGNLVQLQNATVDIFTVTNAGDLQFGANADHTLDIATSSAGIAGKNLTIGAGGGGSGAGSAGGTLTLQGGAAGGTDGDGGNVNIDAGVATGTGARGTVSIGTTNAGTINVGAGNTGTTNVNVGTNASAAGGTTTIQSKDTTAIATNGTTRATFDTTGKMYLGDGVTSTSTGNFTIQGSTGAASNAGYSLALQGGTGGSNSNGGDVTLQGGTGTGTGVQGQVKLSAGGYATTTIGAYGSNTTIDQASVDNYSSIAISASTTGLTITVPAPTTKYDGRVLYIQLTGSNPITLSPNGGSSTSMVPNTVYALVWNTTLNGWLAAGTDSNGFIQNQNSTDQSANFRISGTGQANGFLGNSLDTAAASGTLAIGGTNATTVNVGNTTAATAITLQGGTSGAAIAIQSGAAGTISMGTTDAANNINIGSSSLSSGTQTITIGGANTAGGTQNVTIGSNSGAAAGTTAIQSKGSTTISTNGTTRATFDNAGKLTLDTQNILNNTTTVTNSQLLGFNVQGTTGAYTLQNTGAGGFINNNGVAMQFGVVANGAQGASVTATGTSNIAFELYNIANFFTAAVNKSLSYGQNLVDNGDFEIGSSGWHVISGGATLSNTTTDQYGGRIGLRVQKTAGNTTGTIAQRSVTVHPGQRYYASAQVKTSAANTGTASLRMVFFDGNLGILSDTASTATNPGTSYAQRSMSVTAPANAAFLATYIQINGDGAASGFWYWDNVFLTRSDREDPALFKNTTNSANALTVQDAAGTNTLFNVDTSGNIVTLGGTGTKVGFTNSGASATSAVCKDASGYLTTCNTTGDGAAFVQGGNSFGATAVLGTKDANNLTFKTADTNRLTLDQSGNLQFQQASSITTNGALDLRVDTGGAATLNLGTTSATTINIANGTTANTNVVLGTGAGAAGGTTTVQSKGETTIATNGTNRATFASGANTLYMGNANGSGVHATPNAFLIQGTSNSGTGAGGALTVQAGNSGSAANGANLTLSGGTGGNGVNGLVVLTTPTFQTYNSGTAYSCSVAPCDIPQASIDNNAVVVVNASNPSLTLNLPNPSMGTAMYGRIIYVTGGNSSQNFTLSINGGGNVSNLISMRANASATLVWGPGDGTGDWTAAGASSSTTLQAAYDNTIQSSGGAELIIGKTSNTNGLTIRDSTVNPVDGPLVSIQSNSAANLFSVNSNVTEYASNAGAESKGASDSTFPASTWTAINGNTTVSRYTTTDTYIATGQASVSANVTSGTAGTGIKNTLTAALNTNNNYNVSFSARLTAGNAAFTDMDIYYSADGSAASVECKDLIAIKESTWTKVNCSFTAPAGINASNAIMIRQTGTSSPRTYYIDNLSVTIAADYNLVTDGGVDDGTNFATNYITTGTGATVTTPRITTDGNTASSSAEVVVTTGGTDRGIKNELAISPLTDTLYRVSVYAKQTVGASFTDFKVRYTRDGGTNFRDCVDYSTQTVTSDWEKITCYISTDATSPSNPQLVFAAASSANRTFRIDDLSMTLATATTPNVQIGSGANGGPTTLFTLDRGASAPISGDNEALLGSMYYDTTLGKLQCFEADGWGACGSSPDNIVTISPEYTNAVMHGTGVGTMTSDLCSGSLGINDGSGSPAQPTICDANETYNFYRWTSPQASLQEYSIYVTYQLPSTFKAFISGSTSIKGRVDNTTNATINYQVFRSNGSGLTACNGTPVGVATAAGEGANAWDPGIATGTADPSTCGFAASNSIVFKITMSSRSNANAYISDLGFAFSNN